MFESLENRRLMDAAITGGSGHSGFLVDVHGPNGLIVGVMSMDYYAAGYMGETDGTDGSSDDGNPLTGSTGRILVEYTPNTTVQQRMGTNNPNSIIKGGLNGDLRVAEYIKDVTNNFVNFDEISSKESSYSDRFNVYGDYETYYVWSTNCYNFSDKLLSLEAGAAFNNSSTWDGLQSSLTATKKWLQSHPIRKILPMKVPAFSTVLVDKSHE